MDAQRRFGMIRTVVLCEVFLTLILAFGQGCNTVQSPRAQIDDVQITTQVKSKLASDVNASSLTDISVNTTNGVVTLAGQVGNAETKQRAQTVAASVPGVARVNNELQVTPKSASTQ
jgi:osmotically-inducible protein OsmY